MHFLIPNSGTSSHLPKMLLMVQVQSLHTQLLMQTCRMWDNTKLENEEFLWRKWTIRRPSKQKMEFFVFYGATKTNRIIQLCEMWRRRLSRPNEKMKLNGRQRANDCRSNVDIGLSVWTNSNLWLQWNITWDRFMQTKWTVKSNVICAIGDLTTSITCMVTWERCTPKWNGSNAHTPTAQNHILKRQADGRTSMPVTRKPEHSTAQFVPWNISTEAL